MSYEGGVWRTVSGRRVFIRDGQSLSDAMKESEKFSTPVEDNPLDSIMGKEYTGVKGKEAIDKLLEEKQGYVKAAFHREDMGDIALIWGNETLGLEHIIKQRGKQGININDFVSNLSDVVEKGVLKRRNDRGNFEILHNGKMAVISPELAGNKVTFLLTAFKTRAK